jgi:hypothetical protein
LILAGYGLSLFDNKKHAQTIVTTLIVIINLSYLIFSPNAAIKLPRNGFNRCANKILTIHTFRRFCVVGNKRNSRQVTLKKELIF